MSVLDVPRGGGGGGGGMGSYHKRLAKLALGIKAYQSDYIYVKPKDVILHAPNLIEIRAWISDYIHIVTHL